MSIPMLMTNPTTPNAIAPVITSSASESPATVPMPATQPTPQEVKLIIRIAKPPYSKNLATRCMGEPPSTFMRNSRRGNA